jgi:hypothetical protein
MRIAIIAATAFAAVPMIAMAQEPTKDEATAVGGRIRVTSQILNTEDKSRPANYPFSMDRARLSFSRTQKNVEANIQLRFESSQNGNGNEGTAADDTKFMEVNRAYLNFKDVAPGLNLQVGKKIYTFADDTDYGMEPTDAQSTFAKPNSGYGLGLFADYKIPGDYATAYVAVTNGNGKTYTENNSQKAFVSYFKLVPMKGLGVNFGYAANTLKKSTDKNVLDTNISVGMTTSQDLTFVNLGFEYDMQTTKRDGKYFDSAATSGTGMAARVGYKLDSLNLVAVYNMLQKTFEDEQSLGYFGGTLDSKTKTPKGASLVAAAEYTVGSAMLGAQYKVKMNDAKVYKDKDAKAANKNAADIKLYTQVNF